MRERILRYWKFNEKAAETAEGINGIWLNRRNDRGSIDEVENELNELVREGLLEKHRLPGGRVAYRLV